MEKFNCGVQHFHLILDHGIVQGWFRRIPNCSDALHAFFGLHSLSASFGSNLSSNSLENDDLAAIEINRRSSEQDSGFYSVASDHHPSINSLASASSKDLKKSSTAHHASGYSFVSLELDQRPSIISSAPSDKSMDKASISSSFANPVSAKCTIIFSFFKLLFHSPHGRMTFCE